MFRTRRTALLAALAACVLLPATGGHTESRTVVGHGQHTEGPTKVLTLGDGTTTVVGPLTASFSVGPDQAMCAVGEAGGQAGAFNMLVYTVDVTQKAWGTDPATGGSTYALGGTVRSITTVGGIVLEDALSPFTAVASDGGGAGPGDYFHISINTSLWPHTTFGRDMDGNPLPIFAGDVAIDRAVR